MNYYDYNYLLSEQGNPDRSSFPELRILLREEGDEMKLLDLDPISIEGVEDPCEEDTADEVPEDELHPETPPEVSEITRMPQNSVQTILDQAMIFLLLRSDEVCEIRA